MDYQIAPKLAWHGTWNLRYQNIHGSQPTYPGLDQYAFQNGYKITTYVATNSLDWTITPHMLNNFTFGVQSNGEYFYQGADPHQWAPYGNRRLNLPLITTPIPVQRQRAAVHPQQSRVYQLRDDLSCTQASTPSPSAASFKTTSFLGDLLRHRRRARATTSACRRRIPVGSALGRGYRPSTAAMATWPTRSRCTRC